MSTELRAEVPPEPAVGSVVLDGHGVAVQRDDDGWAPARPMGLLGAQRWGWASMLIARGPVRLIWDGATGAAPVDPQAQTTGGPGPAYTWTMPPVTVTGPSV